MKIKQLEWHDALDRKRSWADTPFGKVWVTVRWSDVNLGGWSCFFCSDGNLTSAKAACQADFERRVRECVEGSELDVVRAFCERVNRMAEDKMMATGKLEGSHYAAMRQLLKEMEDAK